MGGQMQGHALLEQYAREISDTTTEILAGVGFGLDGKPVMLERDLVALTGNRDLR